MKLNEILVEQQLNEINWKRALATGALAAAGGIGLGSFMNNSSDETQRPTSSEAQSKAQSAQAEADKQSMAKLRAHNNVDPLLQTVLAKYKRVEPKLASDIVKFAHKYADPVFPTAKDILAIVGIESSFRPHAVSALKRDPAVGLMQVRPGVWGLDRADLDSAEKQVQQGSSILKQYFKKFGNIDAAVHAYNVGETNFRKKKGLNPKYVDKYKAEKAMYLASNQQPADSKPSKVQVARTL